MKSKLAFVSSEAQFKSFLDQYGGDTTCTLAATEPEIIAECAVAGRPVLDLWDHVTESDIARNEEQAWRLCSGIADLCRGWLVFDGCDLIERTRNDLLYAVRYVLNGISMADAALRHMKDVTVDVHFAEMDRPVYWDPPDYPRDIFNAAVAYSAGQRGVECLSIRERSIEGGGDSSSANTSPRCAELPAWWPGSKTFLSVCSGLALNEQHEIFRALSDEARQSWLLVADSISPLPVGQLPIQALAALPYRLEQLEQEAHRTCRDIPGRLAAAGCDVAGVTDNRFFDFVWRDYAHRLVVSARWYAMGKLLVSAFRPSVMLVGYDVFGPTRGLVEAAHRHQTATLSIHHTGLDFASSLKRHMGSRGPVTAWGEFDAAQMEKWRERPVRVFQVGSLREDHAAMGECMATPTPVDRSPMLSAGFPPSIVLLTAKATDVYAAVDSPSRNMASWEEWGEVFRRRTAWHFTVKPHPRYDYHRFYRLKACSWPSNVSLQETRLDSVLEKADVVVLMNNPSTAAVDAISKGLPVIYFRGAVHEGQMSMLEQGGVITVGSVAAAEKEIDHLLQDAKYRTEIVHRQGAFLRKAVVATGPAAVEKLLAVLEQLRNEHETASVGAAKAEDPALHWLTDVIFTITAVRSGAPGGETLRVHMERLAASRPADFDMPLLNMERVGASLMAEIVKPGWADGAPVSTWGLLWAVRGLLPKEMPVCFKDIRMHAVYAILRDEARGMHTYPKRAVLSVLKYVFAPGRLLARVKGVNE